LIKQYREATENGTEKEIDELGKLIAEQTEAIVEESAERDAYSELVDRVVEAIEK
jgi:hypothetical protein